MLTNTAGTLDQFFVGRNRPRLAWVAVDQGRIDVLVDYARTWDVINTREMGGLNVMDREQWSAPRSRLIWGAEALGVAAGTDLRVKLEALLAEVTDNRVRAEFERRLKSDFDSQHLSAVQEFVLHHEFVTRGYQFIREPRMTATHTRPDYRIMTPFGTVIIEATLAADSKLRQDQDDGLRRLVDELVGVHSGLHILAQPVGPFPHNFSPRRVRAFLKRELASGWPVEPEEQRTFRDERCDPPLEIAFTALARGEDDDQSAVQGFGFADAREFDSHVRIREALEAKSGRYGRFEEAYAICVFPVTQCRRVEAELTALIGHEVWNIDLGSRHFHRAVRPDGFFFEIKAGRRRHDHVSGVIVLDEISARDHSFRVYHNPFATRPLPLTTFEGWPQMRAVQEGVDKFMNS